MEKKIRFERTEQGSFYLAHNLEQSLRKLGGVKVGSIPWNEFSYNHEIYFLPKRNVVIDIGYSSSIYSITFYGYNKSIGELEKILIDKHNLKNSILI
jgi:hypothetical protein